MRRTTAAIGSAAYFAAAAGTFAVLVPWLVTDWQVHGSLLIFWGEALLFGRLGLVWYALIGWAGAAAGRSCGRAAGRCGCAVPCGPVSPVPAVAHPAHVPHRFCGPRADSAMRKFWWLIRA
jgi:hypothetical protein